MKKLLLLIPLLLFMSCNEDQLKIVRKGIMALDVATSEYQTNLTELYKTGAVSSHVFDESLKIINGSRDVMVRANEVLAGIDALDPANRTELFSILGPLAKELDPSTMPWIDTIGNSDTQKAVRVSILALRAAVHGLQLYLLFA